MKKKTPNKAERFTHPALQCWHIGIDEAGRGCLAGPVTAGAVLVPKTFDFAFNLPGLDDSKALKATERLRLEAAIKHSGLCWAIGMAWPDEIDEVNILNATFRAMSRAALALQALVLRQQKKVKHSVLSGIKIDRIPLMIDGPHIIRETEWKNAHRTGQQLPPQVAVVNGDALVPAISAAAILAKTQRDRLLEALERRYPGYGLAQHKGYGTKKHLESISKLGLSPQHRKSFRPKSLTNDQCLLPLA